MCGRDSRLKNVPHVYSTDVASVPNVGVNVMIGKLIIHAADPSFTASPPVVMI
jgi:hypothetical protein